MSHYRIEWDLRELGERPPHAEWASPRLRPRGPQDPDRLAFARALATGDIPANAATLAPEKAA